MTEARETAGTNEPRETLILSSSTPSPSQQFEEVDLQFSTNTPAATGKAKLLATNSWARQDLQAACAGSGLRVWSRRVGHERGSGSSVPPGDLSSFRGSIRGLTTVSLCDGSGRDGPGDWSWRLVLWVYQLLFFFL